MWGSLVLKQQQPYFIAGYYCTKANVTLEYNSGVYTDGVWLFIYKFMF